MAFLPELRAFARSPLARREARAAGSLQQLIGLFFLAGGLDLSAILALAAQFPPADRDGGAPPDWPGVVLFVVGAVLVLLPQLEAVGFASTAIVGDRAEDTLEALVMTPMDRREIVWAKLLGRTAPVRRFMIAAAPACVACGALPVMSILRDDMKFDDLSVWILGIGIALVLAGVAWAVLLVQAHCAAAVALYCSARIRQPWLATLAAYGLAIGPQLALSCCCALLGFAVPFVMAAILFDRLVKNFDGYALGETVHGAEPPVYRPFPLPPVARKLD